MPEPIIKSIPFGEIYYFSDLPQEVEASKAKSLVCSVLTAGTFVHECLEKSLYDTKFKETISKGIENKAEGTKKADIVSILDKYSEQLMVNLMYQWFKYTGGFVGEEGI